MRWVPGEYLGPRQAAPPAWKNEDKLVGYVAQAISDLLLGPDPERSRHEYGIWPFDGDYSGLRTWDWLESEAVAAAADGNFRPLAKLLDPSHPLNRSHPPIRAALKPDTYALIADNLPGIRNKEEGEGSTQADRRPTPHDQPDPRRGRRCPRGPALVACLVSRAEGPGHS